jgi:hypothetical protein
VLKQCAAVPALGAPSDFICADKHVAFGSTFKTKKSVFECGIGRIAAVGSNISFCEHLNQRVVKRIVNALRRWRKSFATRQADAIGQFPIMQDSATSRRATHDRAGEAGAVLIAIFNPLKVPEGQGRRRPLIEAENGFATLRSSEQHFIDGHIPSA